MNLTTASRTFQLVTRILDTKTATESFLPPMGDKVSLPLRPAEQPFPRATPESQGISSRHISAFLQELRKGSDLFMQDVLILRNSRLLCACAFDGQTLDAPKYTFSACKSVTSLAIGLLMGDGVLTPKEPVADIFPEHCTPAVRRKLKGMTVEDLLTMRSGVVFAEPEAMCEEDWVKGFLGSALKGEPGKDFNYNSLNTYMLSAIVRRKAGKPMSDFLQERLFAPLGITDTFWECCPQGVEKGGWGLYIRPEDMAKLGQLVLNDGKWQGKQLVSKRYLDAATTGHAVPPAGTGDYNYGYQIWVGRREKSFLFNGMLGQNVLGFPDSGILLVTNAGADTDYQESRYFEIASRYFGGTFPDRLAEDQEAVQSLAALCRSLSAYGKPLLALGPEEGSPFMNRSFSAFGERASSTGLLPLVIQALHNNYTGGVVSVAVSRRGDLPELIYREQDATYRLPVGLGRPVITELSFRGDHYHVATMGRFTHDEEERPVFYIRLEFIETPSVRTIKLVWTGDGALLRQNETPGGPYILKHLKQLTQGPLGKPLLMMVTGGAEEDYLRYRTQQLISPEVPMHLMG